MVNRTYSVLYPDCPCLLSFPGSFLTVHLYLRRISEMVLEMNTVALDIKCFLSALKQCTDVIVWYRRELLGGGCAS